MSDDALFIRTAELSSNLKHLRAEERILSARLRAREGYEVSVDQGTDSDASTVDASQQSADESERLNELRAEIWETAAELEPLFSEFAKSELTQLASRSATIPGRDLGAVCSAAVHALAVQFVESYGSLLSKNNNVAHLLAQFSSHLDPEDQLIGRSAATNRTDVKILRDATGARCRGVRVNYQEVRFIDVEMAMNEFQTRVLKAVEDWKEKRLMRVERRAELRRQLRD
ncbi:hypothetical protein [Brevibacterium aurantiacum]|uniref:hypothetical protein n=1 Tax=Brevibacterium aurantiacum TaxID=273384 RepID=UPI000F62E50D|nr:hypothetical protein [Brevibacterium aurantiacum]AZL06211.1 hypothetical protein CXR24_11950 [Brevibacterium aurantiacum]